MSFYRIKTIKKNGKPIPTWSSRQTSAKVYSIMEHICGFAIAALSPGTPGGFSGNRSTDKRTIKHQEATDRELFQKNRGAFNVKQRQDHDRQQKVREAGKEGKRCFSGHGFEVLLSVCPRQQLIDIAIGMTVDDPCEDVGQVGERIDVVQLTSFDQ
jgi:hypothetical protein